MNSAASSGACYPSMVVSGRCQRASLQTSHTTSCIVFVDSPDSWPGWLLVCSAFALVCWEVLWSGSLGVWAEHTRLLFPDVSWVSLASPWQRASLFATNPSWPCLVQAPSFPLPLVAWVARRPFLYLGRTPCLPVQISIWGGGDRCILCIFIQP